MRLRCGRNRPADSWRHGRGDAHSCRWRGRLQFRGSAKMSRLCRFSLMLACLAGIGLPAQSEAGMVSWSYTSMVAPSTAGQFDWGYSPYYTSYTPYYAGYAPYYTSYYGPYTSSYAPGIACNSCQSCSSCVGSCGCAPCGCAPCGGNCGVGCASGNCGIGCSNSGTSSGSGSMSPTPDPANGARNVENRLERIERHLNLNSSTRNRTYEADPFTRRPSNSGSTNDETGTGTGNGNGNDFPAPRPNRNLDNGGMFEPNTRSGSGSGTGLTTERIPIPGDDTNETVIQSKKPAPGPVDEPADKKKDQSLRLDYRITSTAVSPRERISRTNAPTMTAVTRKKSPTLQVDAQPRLVDIARH